MKAIKAIRACSRIRPGPKQVRLTRCVGGAVGSIDQIHQERPFLEAQNPYPTQVWRNGERALVKPAAPSNFVQKNGKEILGGFER